MPITSPPDTYWRRKLHAYMHDGPDKAVDIGGHEEKAALQRRADQFEPSEFFEKNSDFLAAAADRLPFPHHNKMRAGFDAKETAFRHPFASTDSEGSLKFSEILRPGVAHDTVSATRVQLDDGDARAHFITRWRFWRQWACENDPRLAFIPADTRIPDHTIWNHLSLTTAFQGCFDLDPQQEVALLQFSLGPVQPLIAAARNIRDLWSGSYLLSYLIASALGEVCQKLGPDHILMPSPWSQPLIDLMLADVYGNATVNARHLGSLWESHWRDNSRSRQRFLIPSLPNRFLLLVPAAEAAAWGQHLESTVHETLLKIGANVSKQVESKLRRASGGNDLGWSPDRFEAQLKQTLDVVWQTFRIPQSVSETRDLARKLLPPAEDPKKHPLHSLDTIEAMFAALPKGHHTSYGTRTHTTAWPVLQALVGWLHDAAKQTHTFDAWTSPDRTAGTPGRAHQKDGLTGKEENVLSVPNDKAQAATLSRELSGTSNPFLFRAGEDLGALTLVKRLWHLTWLAGESGHGFQSEDFSMPDLSQLAQFKPFANDSSGPDAEDSLESESGHYFAVLALDGDQMGKWLSGTKTPKVRQLLAASARDYFEQTGGPDAPKAHPALDAFLELSRPLSPSFLLQFSEALANFGLHAVRRIVEAFDGRLVYAGGDDVLALLPAASAFPCASALRAAFRGDAAALNTLRGAWKGETKHDLPLFQAQPNLPGTFRLHPEALTLAQDPKGFDLLVMGDRADVSVGIAIAHIKSPLQDTVREAQRAEKRAKNQFCRGALAVSLLKRSGETIHWGARWSWQALDLYRFLSAARQDKILSNRFPYRIIALLEPYRLRSGQSLAGDFNLTEVILAEWQHVLGRTCKRHGAEKDAFLTEATALLRAFLERIQADPEFLQESGGDTSESPQDLSARRHEALLNAVIGLCQCLAFIESSPA